MSLVSQGSNQQNKNNSSIPPDCLAKFYIVSAHQVRKSKSKKCGLKKTTMSEISEDIPQFFRANSVTNESIRDDEIGSFLKNPSFCLIS